MHHLEADDTFLSHLSERLREVGKWSGNGIFMPWGNPSSHAMMHADAHQLVPNMTHRGGHADASPKAAMARQMTVTLAAIADIEHSRCVLWMTFTANKRCEGRARICTGPAHPGRTTRSVVREHHHTSESRALAGTRPPHIATFV